MVVKGHLHRNIYLYTDFTKYYIYMSLVHLRGPVIQANGRLTFEDDLRSGGLLCFISIKASVRTELANSMVTPGKPGVSRCQEMATLPAGYIPPCKLPSASSSWSLDFIVCEVL